VQKSERALRLKQGRSALCVAIDPAADMVMWHLLLGTSGNICFSNGYIPDVKCAQLPKIPITQTWSAATGLLSTLRNRIGGGRTRMQLARKAIR
jgi:hypothetical protein